MNFNFRSIFCFTLLTFGACVPQVPFKQRVPPSIPTEETFELPPAELGAGSHSLFFIPHREGDPQKLLNVLKANPLLKMTILFPPRYFEQEDRKGFFNEFRILRSSRQIEIGLVLDNEPNLPLLTDLRQMTETSTRWNMEFSWPDDAAFQIARASAKYQKKWGELPAGFLPPYYALSNEVVGLIKRFRINWVMGKPSEQMGVRFFGGLALIIPPIQPLFEEKIEGSRLWAQSLAAWSAEKPFALIDTSPWSDPNSSTLYLNELALLINRTANLNFQLGTEFSESLGEDFRLPTESNPFEFNYVPWVSTLAQKKAWQALAESRQLIEKYKNSGRANLQRLDAALEEMSVAESGPFLLALGEGNVDPNLERVFLATISNIYRLCNMTIPSTLNSLLSARTIQKTKQSDSDHPFREEGSQYVAWIDPTGDDNGPGSFLYPTGRYPKGAFDLREFKVSWTESAITFSANVMSMPSIESSVIVPLVDIYIDINKFSGAGSTSLLNKRVGALTEKAAAWEYAISLSPFMATLYQSIPGGEAREIMSQKIESSGGTISWSIAKKWLRGDPENWRFSVGLLGCENTRKNSTPLPIPVMSSTGEKQFGGASSGRSAAPFIDVLAEPGSEQKERLGTYENREKIILPFVDSR